ALAQRTTGSIAGTVADESGAVVPGVTVSAVHEPTGTHYETVTDASGHFAILNVRVGGPYTVSAALTGFKTTEQKDLTVRLGEERSLQFRLAVATMTETVTVAAEASPIFNDSNTGSTSNVPEVAIQ